MGVRGVGGGHWRGKKGRAQHVEKNARRVAGRHTDRAEQKPRGNTETQHTLSHTHVYCVTGWLVTGQDARTLSTLAQTYTHAHTPTVSPFGESRDKLAASSIQSSFKIFPHRARSTRENGRSSFFSFLLLLLLMLGFGPKISTTEPCRRPHMSFRSDIM